MSRKPRRCVRPVPLLSVGLLLGACTADPANRGAVSGPAVPAAVPVRPVAEAAAPSPQEAAPAAPADPLGGQFTDENLSPEQIRDAVRSFADRYRDNVAAVCDRIAEGAADPVVARRALRMKVDAATAMYDIAVNPSPVEAMINMLVMLSLQVNTAERHGPPLFGAAGGPRLLTAATELQQAAFATAARVMGVDQREELLRLCREWSDQHPDEVNIWYVRLNNLPGVAQEGSVLNMVDSLTNLPGKFLGKLIPGVNAAGQSVSDATLLAERMSWLGPRLLIMSQWRAELLIRESLDAGQVNEALVLGGRIARVAEDLPATLTEQREGLFNSLVENRETLDGLMQSSMGITTDTAAIVQNVNGALDRILELRGEPDPDATPGRPFDITEYAATLATAGATLGEARALLASAEEATATGRLEAKLDVVTRDVRGLIWLGGGVLAGAIALAGILIVLAAKLIPRRG